jgi:hypothetical protein
MARKRKQGVRLRPTDGLLRHHDVIVVRYTSTTGAYASTAPGGKHTELLLAMLVWLVGCVCRLLLLLLQSYCCCCGYDYSFRAE